MATTLKKLTGVGGDVRKIAALLKAKAPAGHILAYISPEEAQVLKDRGGSGKPHADTGIPSFELDDSFAAGGAEGYGGDTQYQTPVDTAYATGGVDAPVSFTDFAPPTTTPANSYTGGGIKRTTFQIPPQGITGYGLAYEGAPIVPPPTPTVPVDIGFGADKYAPTTKDKDQNLFGLKDETLGRLGLAGALGVLGARTAGRAETAGRAGAEQLQNLATPYQQTGAQLQAQAQRGELTPQAQQSLQALQAQAAQGAERRGGVGAAQIQQQVEAFRQQLLAQQYDYGLKLSGIGDNIAMGAIKTGMQADQYVNQLTNQFYTNMAYIASGMSPGVRIGGG